MASKINTGLAIDSRSVTHVAGMWLAFSSAGSSPTLRFFIFDLQWRAGAGTTGVVKNVHRERVMGFEPGFVPLPFAASCWMIPFSPLIPP